MEVKDLGEFVVGERFGKLVVLADIGTKKHGRSFCECRCDCGTIYEVRTSHLTSGAITQCKPCRNASHGEKKKKTAIIAHESNVGKTFGKLAVIRILEDGPFSGVYYECRCECGTIVVNRASMIHNGYSTQCRKCVDKGNEIHGMSYTNTYSTWFTMRRRCSDPKTENYKNYGGRGIRVCDRWQNSFENFLADMGPKPEGMQIDRIDNDGPYSPDNCHWVTPKENMKNRRNSRKGSKNQLSIDDVGKEG